MALLTDNPKNLTSLPSLILLRKYWWQMSSKSEPLATSHTLALLLTRSVRVVKKALSITTSLDTPRPPPRRTGGGRDGPDGNQRDNLKKNVD